MAETEIKIINGRTVCDATARNQIKNKVDKIEGKGLSTVDFTTEKDTKLNGIAENANNYVHPAKHNADVITQDANHRFVTDTEKQTWNNKANSNHNHDNTYATKSSEHTHANKTILDTITTEKIQIWDAKSDFDGNYSSLKNAPILSFNETGELVVTIGDVSKTFVPKVESV
ncbi:hypothetical protein [Terrisporobacter sp.]|uniref:hypothetical protein n=1 Tax=Terrisporobacter sp. TaxID=1965305 RepID=UPI002628EF7D|nr:hypothetical protein [Terrisporobacter sp.]